MPTILDLNELEKKISQPRKTKRKVKGSGFAKQRQVMEQAGYYTKTKKKNSIKLMDKRKK